MPVLAQIALGSALLVVCILGHIAAFSGLIRALARRKPFEHLHSAASRFRPIAIIVLALLASHTAQIYVWAFVLWIIGALQGYEAPIYFSLVSYTTLGYGDIVLAPEFRILGAMSSVTGILAFGMTTAFLVGLFSKLLENDPD